MKSILRIAILIALTNTAATAQWLKQTTRGIPRTADGKADLAAPLPRTTDGKPDLSGMWQMNPGSYVVNMAQDLDPNDIAPSAEARFREHLDNFAKDPGCFLPSGPRYFIAGTGKFIQAPSLLVILNNDLTYRQIFLDGRDLPNDPSPSFMGYSTGHWDGDILVVDTIGLNDRTILDTGGHPHTEALRITERFRRRDFGHMDLQVTFSDPALYKKPMIVPVDMQYAADDELIEYICRENEQDYEHIGKVSDEKKEVPRAILAEYAGVYTIGSPGDRNYIRLTVKLSADELWVDQTPWFRGKGKDVQRLIPVSETVFVGNFGRRISFIKDDNGTVRQLVFEAPEPQLNDITAVRENSK